MLTIGKITKPQGLKGEMKVLPFGDFNLFSAKNVYVVGVEYSLLEASERPNGVFIKLSGIETIEKAAQLKDKEIQIDEATAHQILGEEQFFWQDIIGKEIVASGKVIGRVQDVDNYGSADIVFARDVNGKEFSFPIVKGLCLEFGEKLVLDAKRLAEVVCYED